MVLEDAKFQEQDFDTNVNRSWATEFSLEGITYATSLFWQPLQNKDDPYTEVEETAGGVLEGADLFCIKPGKAPQFGICVSQEGYKNGTLAAAVSLSTALSDRSSFVGVFKVKEGWWYTCVRNDIILSDGDMLFLKEEDAKNQFMSMLAVPDWGRKIAPPEWEIEETEYPDLAKLLQRGTKNKLQKIKALRGSKLFAVVAVSAIVGLWLLYSIVTSIFLSPPKRPIIAPVRPKVVKPVEQPPEIKPWEKLKNPSEVMLQCKMGVDALTHILPPGWKIGGLSCSDSSITTSWKREVGRISWIDKALNKSGINFSGKSISDDGNTVIVSVPFNKIDIISSPPQYMGVDLKNVLNNMFQAIGQDIALQSFSYTSPRKNVYRSIKFQFKSFQNPAVWNDLLIKFSGLEINSIKYDVNSKQWHYEGAIYVL